MAVLLADMGAGVNGWMSMSMSVDADADGNGYAGCGDAVAAAPSDHGSVPLWMGPVLTDALMRADTDMRMGMGVGACVIVVADMEAAAKDEGIAAGAEAWARVQAGTAEADGISEATRACPDFHDGIRVHASTYAPPWTLMMMQGIDTRMMVPEGGR